MNHCLRLSPALALLLWMSPSISLAGEAYRAEVTPFVAYRFSGDFETKSGDPDQPFENDVDDGSGWGIDLGYYRDDTSYYQLLYSRRNGGLDSTNEALQGADVTIEYFHIGGTLLLPQPRGQVGFISMTVGATRFDTDARGYSSDSKFSFSLGGGVRFPITEAVWATLGIRGYGTFVDSDTRILCISDGGADCLIQGSGQMLWEVEAIAGATFRF